MFGGAIANMYKTSYTYDANGNIKNLQRYNAAGVKFDDMTYRYDEQNGNLISNKLYHVNDAIASGIHTADIDDQLGFTTTNITTANNYTYDEIGNLTKDVSEQIDKIKWTVSGKIKKIIRTGISTKPDLEYVYDAMGNRIAKILKPDGSSLENGGADNPTLWTYTYYVRDAPRNQFKFVLLHKFRIDRPAAFYAGGNIMANYQKSTANSITSFKLIERSIYGSSRLGIDKTTIDLTASITPPTILNHNLGLKNYELSNHLGNVTTVISDRKIPRAPLGSNTTIAYYMPDIVSATDYYPFGMTMQERTFSAGGEAYRFGFNGQEKDNEISVDGGNLDFGARIYDSRLGRWMSVDPLAHLFPNWSPFNFALCNPIKFFDIGGLGPGDGTVRVYIVEAEIQTSEGIMQTVYLAKRYYQNITTTQANNYANLAQTPNGWYQVSKVEYDIQKGSENAKGKSIRQPNENAFTFQTLGADDFIHLDDNIFTERIRDCWKLTGQGYVAHELKKQSGKLLFANSSVTMMDPYVCTIIAVDKDGKERVLGAVTITVDVNSEFDYKLNKDEYIRFDYGDPTRDLYTTISIVTQAPSVSSNRAPDTMDKMGEETPKEEDIKAIEKLH